MAKSAHFICKRDSGNHIGLSHLGDFRYRSEAWGIGAADAEALVGGWIYLHETKQAKSSHGGRIVAVEPVSGDDLRYAIIFDGKGEAKGQPWRGAGHGMAWWSGLIDADAPHELT